MEAFLNDGTEWIWENNVSGPEGFTQSTLCSQKCPLSREECPDNPVCCMKWVT